MITSNARTVAGLATALTLAAAPIALAGAADAAPKAAPIATVAAGTGPDNDTVLYNGGSGTNHLQVKRADYPQSSNLFYVVFKDTVDIKPGFNCDYPDKANHKVVRCVASIEGSNPDYLTVNLGAGNDLANIYEDGLGTGVHGGSGDDRIAVDGATAYGDDGNDTITGGLPGEFLYGGAGNDRIDAFGGKDTVYGNSGNDVLNGGNGDDTISGGPGTDRINGGAGKNKITQ